MVIISTIFHIIHIIFFIIDKKQPITVDVWAGNIFEIINLTGEQKNDYSQEKIDWWFDLFCLNVCGNGQFQLGG
jgi:hypothetical protein